MTAQPSRRDQKGLSPSPFCSNSSCRNLNADTGLTTKPLLTPAGVQRGSRGTKRTTSGLQALVGRGGALPQDCR